MIIIILVVCLMTYNSKNDDYASNLKFTGIIDEPTNPNDLLSLVSEDTIFSDYPNSFSNASEFDECLVRSTNAFVWGAMYPNSDDSVAKELLSKTVDKVLNAIPATDLTSPWNPIPGNWFPFGAPWRAYLNALWLYLQESENENINDIKDLETRIELANTSLKKVCGVDQKGSNVTLLARQKIYFLRFVKGLDFTDEDFEFVKSNLPQLDEGKMWPTDGNITDEGGYVFHDGKNRSYGNLYEQYKAALPTKSMSRLNFGDSLKLMKFALDKVSTYTGRVTPCVMSRHLSNLEGIKNEKRIGIEFVDGLKMLVQSQPEWSWAGWANNYTLALGELNIGTTYPYAYFTYPFNVCINTSDFVLKPEYWKLTPGIIYPSDDSLLPEWNGSTVKSIMNSKPPYFDKAAAFVSVDGKYGALSDTIYLPNIFTNPIERHILITENGLKCMWYVHTQEMELVHVLYTGKKIEALSDGTGFVVDDVVFITTNANDKYVIKNLMGENRDLMILLRTFSPKDEDEMICFNIMYKTIDSDFLSRDDLDSFVIQIKDYPMQVNWISAQKTLVWNYFQAKNMYAVNRPYDDNNGRSTLYKKPTVANFPTFKDFISVVNGKINEDGTIEMFDNTLYGYV